MHCQYTYRQWLPRRPRAGFLVDMNPLEKTFCVGAVRRLLCLLP